MNFSLELNLMLHIVVYSSCKVVGNLSIMFQNYGSSSNSLVIIIVSMSIWMSSWDFDSNEFNSIQFIMLRFSHSRKVQLEGVLIMIEMKQCERKLCETSFEFEP